MLDSTYKTVEISRRRVGNKKATEERNFFRLYRLPPVTLETFPVPTYRNAMKSKKKRTRTSSFNAWDAFSIRDPTVVATSGVRKRSLEQNKLITYELLLSLEGVLQFLKLVKVKIIRQPFH